jgi:2-hydroxy-3-keto-5-methylthiopentenyl-1-phosphate phosphatase
MKEKSNQTAVELFKLRLIQRGFGCKAVDFKEAKEMEIKQAQEYAEFCVHCDRNNLPLLDFEGFINLKSEE